MTDFDLSDKKALQAQVDALTWYHTIDVVPGVTTPGWFDLRHALDDLPFPDCTGKRCLDIGTWDGFYAYEMERRGAAEVVALDLPDLADLDYPPEVLADPDFDPSHTSLQARNAGFHLLHDMLDSKVQLVHGSIYDLDPEVHGTFDVVIIGSLLVHLRDPVRALAAAHSVTSGELMSADYVHPTVNALARRDKPLFQLQGTGSDFQWWLASAARPRPAARPATGPIHERLAAAAARFSFMSQGPVTPQPKAVSPWTAAH